MNDKLDLFPSEEYQQLLSMEESCYFINKISFNKRKEQSLQFLSDHLSWMANNI